MKTEELKVSQPLLELGETRPYPGEKPDGLYTFHPPRSHVTRHPDADADADPEDGEVPSRLILQPLLRGAAGSTNVWFRSSNGSEASSDARSAWRPGVQETTMDHTHITRPLPREPRLRFNRQTPSEASTAVASYGQPAASNLLRRRWCMYSTAQDGYMPPREARCFGLSASQHRSSASGSGTDSVVRRRFEAPAESLGFQNARHL
ncbi:hypothetical protein PCL_11528 [Purpureocillium lilacinum]|uniref:Uncharacterized protein n=1 Tax=Purpureocillium lilacinum TaxID=33203 RepID=A0A2U3EAA6_PURLI|nr:hypothetical protein PCL_11528 [Purpureocillium lilacinum]